jgi:luciferase-type oxidoreductase
MFRESHLTLGLFFAIESYAGDVPTMADQVELARSAERSGFAALWARDVPLRDASATDLGPIYDPWVWLGYVTGATRTIALAVEGIVLPLRHPLDVAKAAASVDNLSGGRFVLGLASGDRPVEFPAYGLDIEQRGALFRESVTYMRRVLEESFPTIESPFGSLHGADLVPKPLHGHVPIGVTGSSQQDVAWIAAHSDLWIMTPRAPAAQAKVVALWRTAVSKRSLVSFKPFAQSLYLDLVSDPNAPPKPIHRGYRVGRKALGDLLHVLERVGVNHVVLNLKYGHRPAAEVIEELGREVVPHFAAADVET